MLCAVGAASWGLAANGTWNSTAPGANGYWTNSLNWSASPAPYGTDAALFNNADSGNTALDLAGLSFIRSILFDTASVAPYSFGSGAANSQTLVLADGGEIALSSSAANSQTFNCGLQLGTDRSVAYYILRNDNPARTLTFNNVQPLSADYLSNQGTKSLLVYGTGPVTFLGTLKPAGAQYLYLTITNSSTVTLTGSNVLSQVSLNGGPDCTLDIGDQELYLNLAGANVLNCTQGGTINGTGKLRVSTTDNFSAAGYNYADYNVAAGRTLVINPSITGPGGIETWLGSGTFVLNGLNTFESHIIFGTSATIVCSKFGNRGSLTSNLGQGTNINFSSAGKLVYTGTGESSDRVIVMNSTATLDQSGPSGKLNLTATPVLSGGSRQLTLQGSAAGVGEFSAILANTGGNVLNVVKAGSGTWILSGTNTYTGTTAVNGGKLLVNYPGSVAPGSAVSVNNSSALGGNGRVNGAVTVAAGGILAPGDVNAVGTLSLSNTLSLTGSTLFFDLVSPDAANVVTDKVAVAGALTLNTTNTIVVSFPNGSVPAGSYTLMTHASRTGTGSFRLSPAYPNVSLFTNATLVRLDVGAGGATAAQWKGNHTDVWDGEDLNWVTGGSAADYANGDVVAFDDTATRFTVSSAAPVAPGAITFNNSANDYTVSAAVTGTGAVYKIGAGLVTLTGNNAFTGAITVAAGTLKIGGAGVLGGGNYTTNIVNNGELIYASSVAQTNSGTISGGGNLTAFGSAPLTLSGTNTYSGLTIVTNSTLRLGHAYALGATSLGTVVAAGGTLEFACTPTGGVYAAEPVELRGTLSSTSIGTNNFGGAITFFQNATIDVGADSALFLTATTLDNGSNTVTKTGSGLLRFTADPNHRSVFVIGEGTVDLQHGGGTDAPWIVNPGATLRELNANIMGDYPVQANGTLDFRTSDQLGALSGIGLVTNSGASAVQVAVGGGNLNGAFTGLIRNGDAATVGFSKVGNGVQTLSGANTYSGFTTNLAGTLNINYGGTDGSSSAIGVGPFVIAGGSLNNTSGSDLTLTPNNPLYWNGDFTFIGAKSLNLGSGGVALSNNRTVTVLTNTLAVGGAISGAFNLTKAGAGTLRLDGKNSYGGSTTVNGGTLFLSDTGTLAPASAVTVNYGATLAGSGSVSGTVTVAAGGLLAPGGVSAVGTLTLANDTATAVTLNGGTLLFDLADAAAGAADKILVGQSATSKLVLNGTNVVALSFPSGKVLAGSYTLMTCAGGITTNANAALVLQGGYTGVTLDADGNDIVLTVGADIDSVTWSGDLSGSWDGAEQNWTNGSALVTYPAGSAVTFDDTAVGNFSVSSAGEVSPYVVLFNNSATDFSVSGTISGSGQLVKSGTAAATFASDGAYNPSALAVLNGTLTLSGATTLNGGSYANSILNNGVLNFSQSSPQVLGGTINGAGTLTASGNSTLTLSGSNFYSGVTLVSSGTLRVMHAYALGTTGQGTVVSQNGTLDFAGNVNLLSEALTLNGGTLSSQSGSNTVNGTTTLAAGSRIDVGTGSTLSLKAYQANGAVTKTGSGWLRFLTDPNGNGQFTVAEGTAELAQSGGAIDANIFVSAGATLIDNTPGNDGINILNRLTVNAGGTFVLRISEAVGGLSGAGLITRDLPSGQANLTFGALNVAETFSGVIQNGSASLNVTKAGTGVQTFTGENTYTGATAVTAGTLLVNAPGSLAAGSAVSVSAAATLGGNGTVGGNVTVAANGCLAAGGVNAIDTLTLGGNLTLNGSTLYCDLSATGGTCDLLAVAGALTLNGVNTVALAFPAGTAEAGTYTLITFASRAGAGSFTLLDSNPNASLAWVDNSLVLTVTGDGASGGLTWNGSLTSQWDGGLLNWKLGAAPASFTAGDAVLFDDTAYSFTLSSAGAVAPSAVTFNNSIAYTVLASLDGTGPLAKFGSGAATVNSMPTYNPASLTVSAGTLTLGYSTRLNSGDYSGSIALNGGTLTHGSTASQILSGPISGIGTLAKNGSGTLVLTGANSHSGGTTVSAGTLYAKGSSSVLGTGTLNLNGGTTDLQNDAPTYANAVSVGGASTLRPGRLTSGAGLVHTLGALTIGNYQLSINTGSLVTANSPYGVTFGATTFSAATPIFDVANNGTGLGTLTLGALSGNNNFTKQGAGLLYLGTASSRAGGTATLTAGTLKLGAASALGTTASTLTLSGGILNLALDATVNAHGTTVGGNALIQSDRATATAPGITHTLGSLTFGGKYTLVVTNGPSVAANTPYGLTFGTTTLTNTTVTLDVGNNGTGLGTLTLGVVGSPSQPSTLVKRGNGTLRLGSVNPYPGATTNTNGRILGVTPGMCSNSTFVVQASGTAAAAPRLAMLCTASNTQWVCNNLIASNAVSPATSGPTLEFVYSVIPSTNAAAPLRVLGNAYLATNTAVIVYLSNYTVPTNGSYALVTVNGTATTNVPALTVVGGYAGSTLSWTNNTLWLNLSGTPSALKWGSAAAGVWDVNNAANAVWKDALAASAIYAEPVGVSAIGDRVQFDDTYLSASAAVTLSRVVMPASVAFSNTTYAYTLSGSGAIVGATALAKGGTNTLTLATTNSYSGGTAVGEGILTVAMGGGISHSGADVTVAASPLTNALLKIDSGASVSGRYLLLGTVTGAVAAVQNQGTLLVSGNTVANFALGAQTNSYGYYRHDSAVPLSVTELGIGSWAGGHGVLDVVQGTVSNVSYFLPNRGVNTQHSQINVLNGGRFVLPNQANQCGLFYSGGSTPSGQGVVSVGSGGLLTSAGTATELDLIKSSSSASAFAALNINAGGTVQATRIKANRGEGTALVNFNGGTLRANVNGTFVSASNLLGRSAIDRVTVFEQGAIIDTVTNDAVISASLQAPTGSSVTGIPVTESGTGYIGRPIVLLTGGGGVGATAMADYDPDSQQVTGVTLTSPGYGYTTAPAVSFVGGGGVPPTLDTVTIAPVGSGGLLKLGSGTLTLRGTNTFCGATVISNGTLCLGVQSALPSTSTVVVAGGVLDLNGFTVTNDTVTLLSGSIINGRIVAKTFQGSGSGVLQATVISSNGLTKSDSSVLTLSTPQTFTGNTAINEGTLRLNGRMPGLYEGRILGNQFDLTSANPKTSVLLSTRYANMYFINAAAAGGIWPDNTTYIYTGYLWNDAPTNEVWTFYRGFDDHTSFMINGVTVLKNSSSGAQIVSNAVMNAGANAFELRLGEGGGAVGANRAEFPNMGVGYDRMGRGTYANFGYFKTFADPGDGSLLTLTNTVAQNNLLPTGTVVTVASGALLDLGGTTQSLAGLSGLGAVSNGTLTVNGTIAPGGLGTLGTLGLPSVSTTFSGTLHIDVSDDGTCDVLAVGGSVNLSGLVLSVDNPGQLNKTKAYTIVTCTGTRTGTFRSKNLPSGWIVLYETNGIVRIVYVGGTLIRIR